MPSSKHSQGHLKDKVEAGVKQLVADGVMESVQFSNWAAPLVPVTKKDGSVRLCGDYKLTVNRATKTDTYHLPRIESLFASLSGGTVFSKLDLSHVYLVTGSTPEIHLQNIEAVLTLLEDYV